MAESPALAQVCGVEVDAVVRWTWILSGALAAIAGVFIGLTPQLYPEIGFNLLLSLFAAAILGGAGSLFGAVVGGLLVGLAENLSVLVVSPGTSPRCRFSCCCWSCSSGRRASSVKSNDFDFAVRTAFRQCAGARHDDRARSYLVFFGCIVLILGTMALGLNLQWGYTGLFNAGIVGFYAIGAYTHAILTAAPRPSSSAISACPGLSELPAAMATTAFAAWIVGLVTIRLRGDYLAISTFGIAIAIQLVTLNWEGLTGGVQGLSAIPRPLVGWFETPFGFNLWYLGLLIAVVGAVYWALERILRSPWGRVLKAIREDETAAIALGKSARHFRLEAFVLGSMLMGLAGALYVSFIGFVSPFDFLPILTFQIWAMVIVGGSGNNSGALLGAFTVWAIWAASGVAVTKLVPPAMPRRAARSRSS